MRPRVAQITVAFRYQNPDLFHKTRGCGCRDAGRLMGKWGRTQSLKRINTLARLVAAANKQIDPSVIRARVENFLQAYPNER